VSTETQPCRWDFKTLRLAGNLIQLIPHHNSTFSQAAVLYSELHRW